MSYALRDAAASDIDEILSQLKSFSDFYPSKKDLFGPDMDYNRNLINSFIDDHLFILAIDDSDNSVAGFIAGVLRPHVYNPSIKVLAESFWWVQEGHRSSSVGSTLLNSFINIGKEQADWIIMTIESISNIKDSTLEKRGFKMIEKSFLMEV